MRRSGDSPLNVCPAKSFFPNYLSFLRNRHRNRGNVVIGHHRSDADPDLVKLVGVRGIRHIQKDRGRKGGEDDSREAAFRGNKRWLLGHRSAATLNGGTTHNKPPLPYV